MLPPDFISLCDSGVNIAISKRVLGVQEAVPECEGLEEKFICYFRLR